MLRAPRVAINLLRKMREMDPDRICEHRAEAQHGVIHRSQAIEAGLSPSAIGRKLALGKWSEVHPNVYHLGGAPETPLSKLFAAWLWIGDGFISHTSAARLWELDGIPDAEQIELTAYRGTRAEGVRVHRLRPTDRPPLRVIHGMAVTSIERTLFDLAGDLPLRYVGLAMDDALRRKLTTLDRLWEAWKAFGRKGRKGTKAFKILLFGRDDREGLLRSRLESKMLRILRRVSPPVPNHRVTDGSRVAYLDFAYPTLKIGIETHGALWHHGEERWKKDLVRDRWLKSLGWSLLYYSWDDVHLSPAQTEKEVRGFLEQAKGSLVLSRSASSN